MALPPITNSGAHFDATGRYRYLLWRAWNASLPSVCFVMLNPGTATADADDPTIRRCIRFAADNGFGRLEVVNLFAYRTPNPTALRACEEPTGPGNERHIAGAISRNEVVIAAWGIHGARVWSASTPLLATRFFCLGVTKANHPRHPLYVRANTRLQPWTPTPDACSPVAP